MYSPQEYAQLNAEATMKAMEQKLLPFQFHSVREVDMLNSFPFPKLGEYVPHGWTLLDEWFVDKSGVGTEDEPAMTIDQAKEKMKEVIWKYGIDFVGFGLGDEGQFQVFIKVYHKLSG